MNIFKIASLMLAFLFGIANSSQAQVVLDQSFDAIAENPFNPGRSSLTATQSLTQTFTVGQAGLLFQIDVQVNSTAPTPTTGLVLDLLQVSNGQPILSSLGSVDIPRSDIPPLFLGQNVGEFVSVDVSGLGINVNPGDVLAFELTHPTDTGAYTAFVGTTDGYSAGQFFFRNPPETNIMTSSATQDIGFQTFVQVPEPTGAIPMLISMVCIFAKRNKRARI